MTQPLLPIMLSLDDARRIEGILDRAKPPYWKDGMAITEYKAALKRALAPIADKAIDEIIAHLDCVGGKA